MDIGRFNEILLEAEKERLQGFTSMFKFQFLLMPALREPDRTGTLANLFIEKLKQDSKGRMSKGRTESCCIL